MSQAKRSTAVTVDDVSPAATEVKSGAAELAQQLADNASDVGKSAMKAANNGREAVAEGYERLSHNAKESFQQGRERSKRWGNELQNSIRARPLFTLLWAVALGALFGMFISKRPGGRR
jgi:ElaB/YqjD/DUF883 family membrane-anchored ribosome-binding protein